MQTNREILTREFCRDRRLIFFPKTEQEAEFIQRRLFGMGFKWPNGATEARCLDDCVAGGMILTSDGAIYHRPSRSDNGLLCTSAQFDENYLPPDMALLMEQFNQLSAQMKELAKSVAEIQKELQPQKLDKPIPKNPGQNS
jgi:hypothetical protein